MLKACDCGQCVVRLGSLGLIVMFAVVLSVLPAADTVSAAGSYSIQHSTTSPDNVFVVPRALAVPGDEGGWLIYLPLTFRRWPPVPYAPVFTAGETPLWDSPIVLNWTGSVPMSAYPIDYYVLEESLSDDWQSAAVYQIATDQIPYTLPLKPLGTMGMHHYRVRGHNAWGLGDYSAIQNILLLSSVDAFTCPETGWKTRRTSSWDLETMVAEYADGSLITRVEDRFDFAVFSPMRPAPAPPYSIKMMTKIIHKANETSYGIVFGGNEGTFCDVERDTAADPDGCFAHYYRLNVIWGGYLKFGLARIDGHKKASEGGSGYGENWGYLSLKSHEVPDPDGWNQWEIRVYDSGFAVYVNDIYLTYISDTTYIHDPYYGIFSSTYEYNGARFQHESYGVSPLAGKLAVPPTEAPLYEESDFWEFGVPAVEF